MHTWLRKRAVAALAQPGILGRFPAGELASRLVIAANLALGVPLGKSMLSGVLSALAQRDGHAAVEAAVREAFDTLGTRIHTLPARRALYRAALDSFASSSLPAALRLGDELIARAPGRRTALMLARQHRKAGAIRRPLAILGRHGVTGEPMAAELHEELRLLTRGMPESAPAGHTAFTPRSDRRVLYYASQSRPHHTSGYAIRTHYLLGALRAGGWDATCFTRFGYPNDRWDFRSRAMVSPGAEVDAVPYVFAPDAAGFRELSPLAYHEAAVGTLIEQIRSFRPAVIHAASNYLVGQAGTEAARRCGLPSIYEVRGWWHMTRASRQPEYADSDHYRMSTRLEAQAAARADHVFAITGAVRDLLVAEGVRADRITVLPNAVHPDGFAPRPRDEQLAGRLGIAGDEVVIGFVGSFVAYEGLDLLLDATVELRRRHGDRFRLLLVGDGAAAGALRARARALGVADRVSFTGRVPHAEVAGYYSLIDVAAYPRRGVPVCEAVSPLKPLEAMAMAKAVVVSSVRAQAEMVEHERTGLIHVKDDVDSLTAELSRLIESAERRRALGEAARSWVREQRSWRRVAEIVAAVYRQLL